MLWRNKQQTRRDPLASLAGKYQFGEIKVIVGEIPPKFGEINIKLSEIKSPIGEIPPKIREILVKTLKHKPSYNS